MTAVQTLSTCVLADLRLAKRDGELVEIMTDFAQKCDFIAFQLAPGPHNPTPDPTALLAFGSYNLDWKRQYATEPSCRHDPARAQAILRAGSVQWRRIFASVRDPDQRDFVARARAQGFKDGVTTPIHGPQGCVAIMMFAAQSSIDLDGEDEEALSHIAMALHQRVRRIAAAAIVGIPPPAKLTTREIECLHWVLEGKTNWEIGVLTGVTARTVQFHLGNAARKLDVTNRVQAAVSALVRGDLTLHGLSRPAAENSNNPQSYDQMTHGEPPPAFDSRDSKYCAPFSGKSLALDPRF
jgi:DNA-binding CsgD family transcriptional regulator